MSHPRLLVALLGLSLLSLTATAQEPPRRVLASCMSKRMGADRAISYNDAQRACRDLMKSGDSKPQTAANAQSKPVS